MNEIVKVNIKNLGNGVYDIIGADGTAEIRVFKSVGGGWSSVHLTIKRDNGGVMTVARAPKFERIKKLIGMWLRDRNAGCVKHPSEYGVF